MTAPKIKPATAEWEALTEALDLLAEDGQRTPCHGSDDWTSEDETVRASAAVACRACPLTELCHAAAVSSREPFGVWAGRDRSPRALAPPKTTTERNTA